MKREKTVFWLYTSLNGIALFTLLLLVLKATPLRMRLIESGLTFGLLACFVLIPIGAIVLWLMGRKHDVAPARPQVVYYLIAKLFLTLVWISSVVLVAFWIVILVVAAKRYDETTERHVFPSGDILYNETYVTKFRDTTRHNKYTLEFADSHQREVVGETVDIDNLRQPLANLNLVRQGERMALILGQQIFTRWDRPGGVFWYKWDTGVVGRFCQQHCFLRSLSPADVYLSEVDRAQNFEHQRRSLYTIEQVDLRHNILVVRAPERVAPWPQRLIYSAQAYGHPWYFDLERTKQDNAHVADLPFPANVRVAVYFVTVPKAVWDRSFMDVKVYEHLVGLPGAKVLPATTATIDADNTRTMALSTVLPSDDMVEQSFVLKGAWGTAEPGIVGVHWNRECLFLSAKIPKRVHVEVVKQTYVFTYAKLVPL